MQSLVDILISLISSPKAIAIFLGAILTILVVSLISYIYLSFVFFSIGKKCKVPFPRIALIPFFGPALVSFNVSRMPYWPWFTLIVFIPVFLISLFLTLNIFLVILGLIAFLTFFVYLVIWNNRMFRILKRPGYWAYSLLFFPLYFVLVGLSLKKQENTIQKN